MEALRQAQLLFQDGDLDIDTDGDPDLGFDSVGRRTNESFDSQLLFDPFEKQVHLPATLIEQGNGKRRQLKIVGQIDEGLLLSTSKNRTRRNRSGYSF